MANAELAIQLVIKNEGGSTVLDSPNDSGGITKFGISYRFLKEIPQERLRTYGIFEPASENTIRELTNTQAQNIYKGEFWDAAPFEKINSQLLANYLFDMSVNHGIAEAVKLLQRSLWAVTRQRDIIKDDGVMGPKTLELINSVLISCLMPALVASRAGLFMLIAEKRPKDNANLNGWLNRCYQKGY